MASSADALLRVEDLRTYFELDAGTLRAVDGVSFTLSSGRVLCIVGESGSGKSVTMLAVLGLLPSATVDGSARYRGTELVGLEPAKLRAIRGRNVSMVFQDPMTSLNPVLPIGKQLALAIQAHQPSLSRSKVAALSADLLGQVAIAQPRRRLDSYPHELSGGMRQRVMIAMAIANDPEVLIADEPTTALDVTVQAQIMELLEQLQREHELAMVLITHDLGVVAGAADRVAVMYAGRIVEFGRADALFAEPNHPYTQGLLACLPRLDNPGLVRPIAGLPPTPRTRPSGCPFHPRCPRAEAACAEEEPALVPHGRTTLACSVVTATGAVSR